MDSRIIWLFLCGSFLFIVFPAKAQNFSLEELAGVYTGFSDGLHGNGITLDLEGNYVDSSGGCGRTLTKSGIYTLDSGILKFKQLKRIDTDVYKYQGNSPETDQEDLKDVNAEMNLLDSVHKNDLSIKDWDYEMLPIRWGKRIYLIKKDELMSFVNAINLGIEPRKTDEDALYNDSFYLKVIPNPNFQLSQLNPVPGFPQLPDNWNSYLLKKPIIATVISIEGDKKTAIINKGKVDGLKVGMRLVANNEEPTLWSGVEVISVENKTAKVKVSDKLKVGDKLSSKIRAK